MTYAAITDFILNDGSRHFLSLPQSIRVEDLISRITAFPDMEVTHVLSSIPESWVDFEFEGQKFSVNDQFGEYWFFVDSPQCPLDILTVLRDRLVGICT